jgi:hypothetical protein
VVSSSAAFKRSFSAQGSMGLLIDQLSLIGDLVIKAVNGGSEL